MAKKPARKKISETVGNVGCYELDGTIGDAIKWLQRLAEQHGEDARLDYGQHDSYDDSYSYDIVVERDETDKEYDERVTREKAIQRETKRRELAELERLIKKYGSKK